MNPDPTSDRLRRRAAVHAALADPARLAIVEALLLGDASPSHLQGLLGQSSNLVAHHLRVLEEAGVVARRRSEADRRRTYVHLLPACLEQLVPTAARTASRVVFVCTHNSARSQLADVLWRRRSTVPSASAGTEPAARIHPGARAAARRHRLALGARRPHHVDKVLGDGDLVVSVCDRAHELIGRTLGAEPLHWSVPDPVAIGTERAFDHVVAELATRVEHLAPLIHQQPAAH